MGHHSGYCNPFTEFTPTPSICPGSELHTADSQEPPDPWDLFCASEGHSLLTGVAWSLDAILHYMHSNQMSRCN